MKTIKLAKSSNEQIFREGVDSVLLFWNNNYGSLTHRARCLSAVYSISLSKIGGIPNFQVQYSLAYDPPLGSPVSGIFIDNYLFADGKYQGKTSDYRGFLRAPWMHFREISSEPMPENLVKIVLQRLKKKNLLEAFLIEAEKPNSYFLEEQTI